MIAADTSSLISYFSGEIGEDVDRIDEALQSSILVFPPAVVTEVLSDANLPRDFVETVKKIPMLEIQEGFWHRAAENRAIILKRGFKARLADTLIAQSCIDNDVPLIARDQDYRHFAKFCKLTLHLFEA